MTKRCLAILLVAMTICLSLVGCANKNDNSYNQIVTEAPIKVDEDTTSFKLSYSQSDSLNPYESKTLNNQIISELVYEPLFTIDERYEVQPALAVGYSYTDKTTLVVTIESGHIFSDSSPITAEDVVASFNEAQVSPRWKNSLAPIKNAYTSGANAITFELSYADPGAHKLLTFAITKANYDNEDGYLVGSGRYVYSNEDGGVCLNTNKKRKDFTPHFTKISLINITTSESIDNAVNIGNITYAFRDLAEGDNTRMNCNKKNVSLNNLVYIGINSYVGITSNKNIRQAISLATDRQTIVKSAYQGNAVPSTNIYHPASAQGKETTLFSTDADIPAAKQAIAQSGYGTSELKLDILVNKNRNRSAMAKLLKQQLEAIGFKITITELEDAQYKSYVKNGYFDIYIGETKIPNDLRLNSFFDKKGETRFGIDSSLKVHKTYKEYMNGDGDVGTFLLNFYDEMPFIPVVYRQGMICYSKSMHGDMQAYNGNYFSNIQDWYCS